MIVQPAAAGAAMLPHAAVRTVGAVRGLSESGLIVGLSRGRMWIGVLCALLAGIVALNVLSLELSAGSGQLTEKIDDLERRNSALAGELAEKLAAANIEALAVSLGLIVPASELVTYFQIDGDRVKRTEGIAGVEPEPPPIQATVAPEISSPGAALPVAPVTAPEPGQATSEPSAAPPPPAAGAGGGISPG